MTVLPDCQPAKARMKRFAEASARFWPGCKAIRTLRAGVSVWNGVVIASGGIDEFDAEDGQGLARAGIDRGDQLGSVHAAHLADVLVRLLDDGEVTRVA